MILVKIVLKNAQISDYRYGTVRYGTVRYYRIVLLIVGYRAVHGTPYRTGTVLYRYNNVPYRTVPYDRYGTSDSTPLVKLRAPLPLLIIEVF